MRVSTMIKRRYQDKGITVYRALQDDCMIRLTVPVNTPHLDDEVRRAPAQAMIGPALKNKMWVWIWSGRPEWYDGVYAPKVS